MAPDEPVVVPLSVAVERWPELVESRLGAIVDAEDPFVARNEAAWHGGAFVYVPRGQRLDAPVLLSVVQEAAQTALSWRTLIVLEEGAEAEVWEQYLSADPESEGLLNTVVEISVGPGANLRYMCGQALGERAWIFGSQRAEVDRDATFEWIALGFGSARGKVRMETKLAGQGASARVTGAYAGRHRQHLDFDTTQEHAAPNTTSDLAFRGLLGDRSTAVWRGMIRVDPGAQQTDAFQESRNLLLSKRAHADAIPGLEILANDVRCTHAAAIAQIDADQLFYLQTRGLPRAGRVPSRHRGLPAGARRALPRRPRARRPRPGTRAPSRRDPRRGVDEPGAVAACHAGRACAMVQALSDVATATLSIPELAEAARAAGRLGIDTEFISEGHYRPQLCLVQIAVPVPRAAARSPSRCSTRSSRSTRRRSWRCSSTPRSRSSCTPAARTSPSCAAPWRAPIVNVFDTQVSAGFAGFSAQAGYTGLLHDVLRIRLAKSASFTRWDVRPLTPEQVRYAREDVEHLLALADALQARLDASGRLDWAREESRAIDDASDERDPEEVWRRLPAPAPARPARARRRARARRLARAHRGGGSTGRSARSCPTRRSSSSPSAGRPTRRRSRRSAGCPAHAPAPRPTTSSRRCAGAEEAEPIALEGARAAPRSAARRRSSRWPRRWSARAPRTPGSPTS